jgi:glycosyltransferase involved in cell wall biosynthesis
MLQYRTERGSAGSTLMLDQITPLILTYNEAPNIARTLASLSWAKDIVILDSLSDDDTLKIASSIPHVRIFQRAFDSHWNQWEFGLKETGISTPWVLALDADYVLSDELVAELTNLQPETQTAGYRANFVYCINGKKLNSGVYPPVTVLYRREAASYIQDGHTQRVEIEGRIQLLRSPMFHDDRKSLKRWFHSQSRYIQLEAQKLLETDPATLRLVDRMRRWWFITPPAMLFYCLIVRGGIFDGWQGFYYAFQRTLAELMLSRQLLEHSFNRDRVHTRHQRLSRRRSGGHY